MTCGILARALLAALLLFLLPQPACAQTSRDFLYGATFFYERIPRNEWSTALARYRTMGINTIDLYVMWNWHELAPGVFDFTGRTNTRRDLRGLFRLIHDDGFRVVLRPGPVIRNEWRNGGYPAWLLTRPEYQMPLRDVLEGRYPATATLQNQHSDAAAQEWMRNTTHMRYATRWLDRVFHTVLPWRNDIVGVALDDDQGAYLDNDTWPGPHFQRYIAYLASIARRDLGTAMPVFINTYQMKVTASAPVWAWGNWYQSDAYAIGEHDRAQLEFSAGLLQTQHPSRPLMISEFQAGWLQGADQARPRPADPSNTALALHTLLQMGVHGVVNFPVQDTLNPSGWEAPWTNALYAWDAALSVQLTPQTRYAPTARFGSLIATYGSALVKTQRASDAAIAYLTSAYDAAAMTNDRVAQIAQATIVAQRGCRVMHITCSLVDLRYATETELRSNRVLIVPRWGSDLPYIAAVRAQLARYRAGGGHVVRSARYAKIGGPAAGGIPNAVLLVSDDRRFAFLDVVNYGSLAQHISATRVHYGKFSAVVPAQIVAARNAMLVPLGAQPKRVDPPLPLRSGSFVAWQPRALPANGTIVYRGDVYADGFPAVVFENTAARLIVSPCAGGRAFVFEDKRDGENLFTTIGGLRDAWSHPLPPSPRDYIARYTHPIATGTFNRCYATSLHGSSATLTYAAPDAPPAGASFTKTVAIDADAGAFTVTMSAQFANGPHQRAQQLTSFSLPAGARILSAPNGYAIYEAARRRVVLVSWPASDVEARSLATHPGDALLTLTYAAEGSRRTRYGFASAVTVAQAQAALTAFTKRP